MEAKFANWDSQISAHATMPRVGNVGMTVFIIILKGRRVHRNLRVHGKMLMGIDNPVYLTEVAGVHAIRTMHDWIRENVAALRGAANAAAHSGGHQLRKDIAQWLRKGVLGMGSIAASLFVGDAKKLRGRLKVPLACPPRSLPGEEMRPEESA